MLALIISRLDLESKTKFQKFTLYSGRHLWVTILVHHGCTPTWRFHTGFCKFLGNIYDEYLKFDETHRPTTWRTVLFFLAFSIGWLVFNLLFFLLCDSENDLHHFEERNGNCRRFFFGK